MHARTRMIISRSVHRFGDVDLTMAHTKPDGDFKLDHPFPSIWSHQCDGLWPAQKPANESENENKTGHDEMRDMWMSHMDGRARGVVTEMSDY